VVLPILRHTPAPQRLSFSISAALRPRILLVDEALFVRDHHFKQKCLATRREVRSGAGVVVMAAHAVAEIHATCNRAMWLHEGRVEMIGDPIEVTEAYSANKNREPVAQIMQQMAL
jgi:teichoic acid transport system ATP-binding protein